MPRQPLSSQVRSTFPFRRAAQPPNSREKPGLTWTSLYDSAAERFFVARCSLRDGDPTAAARFEGAAAARQVHDLFRRLPESAGKADELLYRLSLGLNASTFDSLSRRRFAAEVRRCLLRGSRSDILIAPLREWVAGRIKLGDLLARLLD